MPKTPAKTEPPTKSLDDIDMERGVKKVKALREKFNKAIDDPEMREAMARYIRGLLREDTKS